jgi:hypothetical protein
MANLEAAAPAILRPRIEAPSFFAGYFARRSLAAVQWMGAPCIALL